MYIESDTKLIKYWHPLETLDSSNVSILKEAFNVCKQNNHERYTNIINSLKSNVFLYICCNPNKYTCQHIGSI